MKGKQNHRVIVTKHKINFVQSNLVYLPFMQFPLVAKLKAQCSIKKPWSKSIYRVCNYIQASCNRYGWLHMSKSTFLPIILSYSKTSILMLLYWYSLQNHSSSFKHLPIVNLARPVVDDVRANREIATTELCQSFSCRPRCRSCPTRILNFWASRRDNFRLAKVVFFFSKLIWPRCCQSGNEHRLSTWRNARHTWSIMISIKLISKLIFCIIKIAACNSTDNYVFPVFYCI